MFTDLEKSILNVAHKAMTQKCALDRLNAFYEMRDANLSNEAWFEWEVYYWLLKEKDYGWIRDKKNRKKPNRQRSYLVFFRNIEHHIRVMNPHTAFPLQILSPGFSDPDTPGE